MARYLITGASRGIGRALVDELASEGGHEILALGRSAASLAPLAVTERIVADLAEPDSLADRVPPLDRLDGLIHCAGLLVRKSVAEAEVSDWTLSLTLNVVAVAELTRLLLPALSTARGRVIILNSGQGINAAPFLGPYAASKFAVRAVADSLRAERTDIDVTSVYLGRTATDMQRELRAAEGGSFEADDYLTAEAVARELRHLLSLPDSMSVPDVSLRPAP